MKRILLLILSILLIASSAYSGQTINGGRVANDDLTLQGTTSSTRDTSYVIVQPSGGKVGIGTTTPGEMLEVGSATTGGNVAINATLTSIFTHDAANYNEDGATWTITGTGPLVHVAGNTTTLTATPSSAIVVGTTYKVTITGTGGGGTAPYTLGGVSGSSIAASGAIAIEDYITAGTTANLIITPASACTVSITSITIKALTNATGDLTVDGNIIARSQIVSGQTGNNLPQFSSSTDLTTGLRLYGPTGFSLVLGGAGKLVFDMSGIYVYDNTAFLAFGASAQPQLYKDTDYTLGQRNSTNQQIYRLYNTWTNASNYERLTLTGVQGASVNITAETAGTGGDNLNIVLTPAGTGSFGFGTSTFGTNAAKVLGIASGTAPTTSPADAAQVWTQDTGSVAGNAALHMRNEVGDTGPVAFAGVKVASHSATETATIPQMYQDINLITGAYTVSMPTAAVGYSTDFMATTAAQYSVDVATGTDIIYLNGSALAAGNKVTSDSTIRNRLHCECNVVGYYECWSITNLHIDGGS